MTELLLSKKYSKPLVKTNVQSTIEYNFQITSKVLNSTQRARTSNICDSAYFQQM